jgi:hypothetical protein
VFTEELQNKSVYINDSAILTCKLNIPTDENVEWRKDNKPVEISNNVMVMSKNDNHWIAISRASLEDTGQYTCIYDHISTSADLIVIGMLQSNYSINTCILGQCLETDKEIVKPYHGIYYL